MVTHFGCWQEEFIIRREKKEATDTAAMEGTRSLISREQAVVMMKNFREVVRSGKTKDYHWRITQLKLLLKLINDCESQICDALRSDLNKPHFEVLMSEVTSLSSLLIYAYLFKGCIKALNTLFVTKLNLNTIY